MVLEIALELAGRSVEGHHRRGEEIVTRALVTHPWPAIAGAPEGQIGLGIVGASDPYRAAASLPLVACGPGFAARLARCRHRVSRPRWLSGLGIERRDKAANAELTTRNAD